MTSKREILRQILSGQLSPAQALVTIRGLSFWADYKDDEPDLFSVEISQHGKALKRRTMTRKQVDELKLKSVSWTMIDAAGNMEWIHAETRNRYPYGR